MNCNYVIIPETGMLNNIIGNSKMKENHIFHSGQNSSARL